MSWNHLRDTVRKVSRDRVCGLCANRIAKGTSAIYRVGIADGKLLASYMHEPCEMLTHDWDAMDWETFSPGDGEWPELEAVTKGGKE